MRAGSATLPFRPPSCCPSLPTPPPLPPSSPSVLSLYPSLRPSPFVPPGLSLPVHLSLPPPPCSLQFFAADAAGQLDVLGHDGDALGMEGAQVDILIEANKVGLGRLLESMQRGSLEAKF